MYTLYVRNFNLTIKFASSSAKSSSPAVLLPVSFTLLLEISAAVSLFALNKFTSTKKPGKIKESETDMNK